MKLSIELEGIGAGGLDVQTGRADAAAALGEPALSAINAGPSGAAPGGGATDPFATAAASGDHRDGGTPSADLLAAVAAAGAPGATGNGTTSDTSGRGAFDAGGAPV